MVQVAYSNSNCIDLWDTFQKQIYKNTTIDLCMICDVLPTDLGLSKYTTYDNADPYYKVWVDALNSFGDDYFIYLQEDFFLYDKVNEEKLNEYLQFLKDNPEYSFVRLIKSGNLGGAMVHKNLYEIESSNQHVFAMQATIWRTSDYIKLMEEVKDPKWFENDKYRDAMIKLNMKGVYHYDNEPKRGLNHYDSNVYPYVATALVRGQWNLGEYPNELRPILDENNIEINKRGIYK